MRPIIQDLTAFVCVSVLVTIGACTAQSPRTQTAPARLATPSPQQVAWQDMEIGMFIHFAPNTWQDQEYDDLSTPLDKINPAFPALDLGHRGAGGQLDLLRIAGLVEEGAHRRPVRNRHPRVPARAHCRCRPN